MAVVKAVSFKDKKDKELIEFIEGKEFSYYIKDLIRKDMEEKVSSEVPSKVEKMPSRKRNINFDM
ncbi:hypothetical protein [Clostridium sp.]|uniref:hypothetical protein n=1 Tax=Clostridium sp. TaxID=1506 RepID=UPI002851E7C3|nr:hypothetical protein [Clostridium sp.]MDR3593572.1 hypothetical protein [Clostridium sp.]